MFVVAALRHADPRSRCPAKVKVKAQQKVLVPPMNEGIFFFFFYEKPSVFAICKNTFSKWKVGGRVA
jgi:hypothetical protein